VSVSKFRWLLNLTLLIAVVSVAMFFVKTNRVSAMPAPPPPASCDYDYFQGRCVDDPAVNQASGQSYYTGNYLVGIERTPNATPMPNDIYTYNDPTFGINAHPTFAFPQVPGCTADGGGAGCKNNPTYLNTFYNEIKLYTGQWSTIEFNHSNTVTACMKIETSVTVLDNEESEWYNDTFVKNINDNNPCFNARREALEASIVINSIMGNNISDYGTTAWNPVGGGPNWVQGTYFPFIDKEIFAAKADLLNGSFYKELQSYDSAGLINWDEAVAVGPHWNTTGALDNTDITVFRYNDPETYDGIVITSRTNPALTFDINRWCGNLIGDLSLKSSVPTFGLTPAAKAPTWTPSAGIPTSTVAQGSVTYPTSDSPVDGIDQEVSVWLSKGGISGPKTLIKNYPDKHASYHNPLTNINETVLNLPARLGIKVGDAICVTVSVNPSGGTVFPFGGAYPILSSNGVTATSAYACTVVTAPASPPAQPYFKSYGGDVNVGVGFGQFCSDLAGKDILGWNSGNPANPPGPFNGAGSQIGASSTGQIRGFASAQAIPFADLVGTYMSIGNDQSPLFSDTALDKYGGNNQDTTCAPSALELAGTTAPTTIAGTVLLSNLLAAPSPSINPNPYSGTHIIYVENGNVEIDKPVIYAPYSNAAGIPSFKLIVENGNIYIKPGVNELDGIYEATGPAANKNIGVINTCSTDGTTPSPYYSTCNSELEVYGSLLSNSLKLTRTRGTYTNGTGTENITNDNSAESVEYSPEVWINGNSGGSGLNTTQSIEQLPPVL
jgi:hypothetical protein